MKKALAIAGILALSIAPTASFACDLRFLDLSAAILRNRNLSNANLTDVDLSRTNLTGITGIGIRGCPRSLPDGWVCDRLNGLIQR